ncbi:transcriptional regulator, PadR-like family [mine drainage metagenome]|uniref:Transcriptional regulator, PadR-like family n=1 Tax=mine drainage metagenome TaxID=410659 RepID=T1DG15_9ZZZZ
MQEQPMHGYQIIQDLETRTNGAWKPSPGSIYPTLQALEDQGLLIAEVVESKRVFTLTDAGREYLNGLADGPLPWETVTKDTATSLFALRDQIKQLAMAVMQLAQSGGEEQVEKAKGILLEAKKKIYLILAEQDES